MSFISFSFSSLVRRQVTILGGAAVLGIMAIAASAEDASALAATISIGGVSEADLKASCERSGGTFESNGEYYACEYPDGTLVSCERGQGTSGCTEQTTIRTTKTRFTATQAFPASSVLGSVR